MPKNPALQHLSSALADAVQAAGVSVVTVDARPRFPASGVLTAPGFVLTASHAVQEDDIKVTLPDGEELSADLLGRDPHSDLALLKLSAAKGAAAQTNEDPQVGQLALSLGRPTPEGMQASLGIVSAVGGPLRSHHGGLLESYLRTDAIPYPGFSGGPLVDGEGRVLGINTSGLGMGASLTIPAKLAWKIAAAIQEHGGVKRGYLGVRSQLVEIPKDALKREQATGLLVMGVEKDSPAATAKLIVSDLIVGFAGQPVAEHDELLLQLNSGVVGKAVDVEVLRGGNQQIVKVTIGEHEEAEEHHHHRHGRHRRWRR
ncbi:MAG: trypsin-like peptidase domain-containing protein [Anaerolineales bacterium]